MLAVVALATVLSLAGCNGSATDPHAGRVPTDAVALATHDVFEGVLFQYRFRNQFTERQRLVIRSADQWAEAWARITGPARPAPAVNFAREMVVLVAMGERPTGGYVITVDGVYDADGRLYAEVKEASPGPLCGTTEALTQPIDAVRVPRRDGPVTFVERAVTMACR
jgi:hypothetical protein